MYRQVDYSLFYLQLKLIAHRVLFYILTICSIIQSIAFFCFQKIHSPFLPCQICKVCVNVNPGVMLPLKPMPTCAVKQIIYADSVYFAADITWSRWRQRRRHNEGLWIPAPHGFQIYIYLFIRDPRIWQY